MLLLFLQVDWVAKSEYEARLTIDMADYGVTTGKHKSMVRVRHYTRTSGICNGKKDSMD